MYMLVHSLASKYARFVVLVRLMYWTPHQTIRPPLLGNQEILDPPPPLKNPGHAPEVDLVFSVKQLVNEYLSYIYDFIYISHLITLFVSHASIKYATGNTDERVHAGQESVNIQNFYHF